MKDSEDLKAVKPEKLSSPPQPPPPDQSNIRVYPDWAAMQAYYGPTVAVPSYFNSAIASGQVPHPVMWGPPQLMMPPYGVPYPALYAPGGVCAHPGIPFAASPVSVDAHAKSLGTKEHGLMKKLKGLDGLAMSIGNGNANSSEFETEHELSHNRETEGSSDKSNGNSKKSALNGQKRSREESPNMTRAVKIETQSSIVPPTVVGNLARTLVSPSVTSSLELKDDSPKANAKGSPLGVQLPISMIPNDLWLHNELDLKREKRKQCNRESARRSRLRKQLESQELAIKVDSLTAENMTLKSEINRLTKTAQNLTNEKVNLKVVLKNIQAGQAAGVGLRDIDDKKAMTPSTANLLSRVDSAGSGDGGKGEDELYEKKTKSDAKLHQLLDADPPSDTVAAG